MIVPDLRTFVLVLCFAVLYLAMWLEPMGGDDLGS